MQYVGFALVALLALFSPVANAQDLKVKVEPVVEGEAAPGQEYTLKLKFTVPDGYHAYHKDNPGVSSPVKVKWQDTAGLKLVKETWPEPKKTKIDEDWFEWELGPVFEIAYHFNVPAEAKGALLLKGSHDTQFCNEEGCLQSEGDFEAKVEVGAADAAREELPKVTLEAKFAESAVAGGQAKLTLAFTFTKGFHAYHKDNPGFGEAAAISFSKLDGLKLAKEDWPEPTKKEYDKDWIEWEYPDGFTLTYTYDVPKDAKDSIEVAGQYHIQVCDDNGCHIRKSEFKASLTVKPAGDTGERRGSGRGYGPALPKAYGQLAGDSAADTEDRKLKVSAAFAGPVKAGTEAELRIEFEVAPGYKTYHRDNHSKEPIGVSVPTTLNWGALSGLQPTTDIWPDPVDNEGEWELKGKFVVVQKFQVPLDASGEITLQGVAHAQICDAEGCLPPDDFEFTASLVIEPADEGATTTETREVDSNSTAAATGEPAPADRAARDSHGFYLDFDYALEQARKEGKQLLVDFNGKFCVPCRKMEKQVFPLPEVKQLMDDFVIVSVQNDIKNARYDELWAKYKPTETAGVPYYAIMDHDAKVLRGIGSTLPAEERAHEFVAFLKGVEPVKPDQPAPTGETSLPKSPPEPSSSPTVPAPKLPDAVASFPEELKQVFDFEARFSNPSVAPGGEVTLELRFKLKEGPGGKYHMYHPDSPHSFIDGKSHSLFLLRMLDVAGLQGDDVWLFPQPKVVPKGDPANFFDDDEWKYYAEFVVVRRFQVPAAAKEGTTVTVTGTLAGQYCDDGQCIWFLDESKTPFGWQASLSVAASGAKSALAEPSHTGKPGRGADHKAVDSATIPGPTEPSKEVGPDEGGGGLTEEIEQSGGLFWFLLGVFGLGMVTLLTPCVLPVLPLTIGFFVKQSEQGRSPLAAAFIYCTCIVGVFTVFGLITSIALGEQGAQIVSTNPWVNLAIGVLFTVFALSFFGLFELRMPAFISSWISRKQMTTQKQGRGYMTALLSGGSFAVISFSCTGPIAATILAGAAGGAGDESLGRWVPTLAMMVFASGLALPIFVMGMFPSLLKKLPKSGGWMNALKVVFAFVEIAVAIRYFAWAEIGFTGKVVPVWINRDLVDAFWIACAAGAGLYLLGVFRMPHDHEKAEQIGVVRMLIAMCFLAFALYMVPGLTSEKPMGMLDGFLPPREERPKHGGAGNGSGEAKAEFWHQDLDSALEESKKSGKPVFVDFTGVICANCRWVEKNIFPQPEVHKLLLDDFVLCQQWTDKDDDPKAKLTYAKYGQGKKGVPMYVIVASDGTMISKYVPPQFINTLTAAEFADWMNGALAKARK